MAISFNEAAFLKYCNKNHNFNKTAVLGRQRIQPSKYLNKILNKSLDFDFGKYHDLLLTDIFKASLIDVYDISEFEGANKVCDFGKPVSESEIYDTFIDFGSSEHIFEISQSFKNIIKLTKIGGMIIHNLPTDNGCGHGFYQISPELFFSLYSEKNGFKDTEIFMIDISKNKPSYVIKLKKPSKGDRIEIRTKNEMCVWVKTIKFKNIKISNVYQSDYISKWSKEAPKINLNFEEKVSGRLKEYKIFYKIIRSTYRLFKMKQLFEKIRFFFYYKKLLDYRNLGEKIYIKDL